MKKTILVLLSLFIVTFSFGCVENSRGATNLPSGHPCAGKEGDAYVDCLERQEGLKELDAMDDRPNKPAPTEQHATTTTTATTTTVEPAKADMSSRPKPSDTPELPVYDPRPPPRANPRYPGVPEGYSADFLPGQNQACMPGQSLSVHNDSDKFLEVSGDDMRPCGDGGVVSIAVSQANSSPRVAYAIPPHSIGTYYFYPWKQVGNVPVSSNGKKYYTIRVYDAGSVKGMTMDTPAAWILTINDYVMTPFDSPWWKRTVTNEDIIQGKAMR